MLIEQKFQELTQHVERLITELENSDRASIDIDLKGHAIDNKELFEEFSRTFQSLVDGYLGQVGTLFTRLNGAVQKRLPRESNDPANLDLKTRELARAKQLMDSKKSDANLMQQLRDMVKTNSAVLESLVAMHTRFEEQFVQVKTQYTEIKVAMQQMEREQAETQRKQREEEERRAAEEERRIRLEEERKQRELEEERLRQLELDQLENQINNTKISDPQFWDCFEFVQTRVMMAPPPPNEEDQQPVDEVMCFIRAPPGSISDKTDISCEVNDFLKVNLSQIEESCEIVSQIITLSPAHLDADFRFDYPWRIAMPYVMGKNQSWREPIVLMLDEDDGETWHPLTTYEVLPDTVNDVFQPLTTAASGNRFVEVELNWLNNVTLVVISNLRQDSTVIGKKGGRLLATVDRNINLTVPPGSLKVEHKVGLQVQPIETLLFQELKSKDHENLLRNVITSSHIISLESVKKPVLKPVTMNFLVPVNPLSKSERPRTGKSSSGSGSGGGGSSAAQLQNGGQSTSAAFAMKARPKTAAVHSNADNNADEELDELHMILFSPKDNNWRETKGFYLDGQKDAVFFEMKLLQNMKFVIFRSKMDASEESLIRSINLIENSMKVRTANVILRQHVENSTQIAMMICPSRSVNQTQRRLQAAGFEEEGQPGVSPDLEIRERQIVKITFRGNIQNADMLAQPIEFMYNSQMKNRLDFSIVEVDKFAQRANDMYRGFVQVFTRQLVKRAIPKKDANATSSSTGSGGASGGGGVSSLTSAIKKGGTMLGGAGQFEWVEEEVLLTEILVSIPKTEIFTPRITKKDSFSFVSNDVVTSKYLDILSKKLSDDWEILGQVLEIGQARIQSIKQDYENGKTNHLAAHEMLNIWVKNLPMATNKYTIMKKALKRINRVDLAEDLYKRHQNSKNVN